MKNKLTFFSLGFLAFAVLALFINATVIDAASYFPFLKSEDKKENMALPVQTTYAVKIPASVTFSGEAVPLDDLEVRERLDRELTVNAYWQSSTIIIFKRANRFLPAIEKILKEEGIHDDFKYLCMAESGFDYVSSPSGASGFWQFMKTAAAENGLLVNAEVDERYDLEKATRAACKYLRDARAKTGSWTAAAAAYNMGIMGVNKAQARQADTTYYNLLLNTETSRYVQRIIAFKIIHQHPKDFGLYLNKEDLYPEFKYTVEQVSGSVNWVEFARQRNTSYKMLRIYNPWIRDFNMFNKDKKTYEVRIPA